MREEKKLETPVEEKKIELTPELREQVKEKLKEEALKSIDISEKDSAVFKEMLDEALMPVIMNDKDFKLGPQELDIRNLSNKNKYQMFFRQLTLQNVYLRNVNSSLIDIMRLIMVLLTKLGVEDIEKGIDDVLDQLMNKHPEFGKNKTN
jgi:hypothetical protein